MEPVSKVNIFYDRQMTLAVILRFSKWKLTRNSIEIGDFAVLGCITLPTGFQATFTRNEFCHIRERYFRIPQITGSKIYACWKFRFGILYNIFVVTVLQWIFLIKFQIDKNI